MSESAKAEKIIDLNEENVIKLNEQLLHDILIKDDIRGKQVCVISVTGEFRQGKSFLLNFFIKYLRMKKEKILLADDQEEWLNLCKHQQFVGFPWKGGRERHTTGILLWPEIFVSKLPSGEEIAIILLDTQGSFDNQTTTTHCASIFALSCLISSVLIYNLKEDIKQTDLSHLACFSHYGQMVSNCKESPFQKIVFLVRDWRWPEEIEYGSRGGQERLDQIINDSKVSCEEVKSQWEIINSLFQEKNCFLMPYPGSNVATKVNSNITDMDIPQGLLFKKYLQKFVVNILTTENLVPKTDLNGDKILVGDLFHYIKTYCQHFQNSDFPPPQAMYMAACESHYRRLIEKSEAKYDDLMKNIEDEKSEPLGVQSFVTQHLQSKIDAIDYFLQANMMGDVNLQTNYRITLENNLDRKMETYLKCNKRKQENTPLTYHLYKYCGKAIHAFRKCFVAKKNDIKNRSVRNRAEALPKLGGAVGGGTLATSAAIGTISAAMVLSRIGIIVIGLIGLSSFCIGSYGGYRISSITTNFVYDYFGIGITTKNCVKCYEKIQIRNYKGESFIVCLTCAKEIYQQ